MKTYDAIICLGGNVEPSGEPGRHSRLRTDRAVQLYKQSVAPNIVFSGKWSLLRNADSRPKTEARAMADYAMKLNVPENSIILEEKSRSTAENAYYLKTELLTQHHWQALLIEVSPYSLGRTKLIFRKVLGKTARYDFDTPADAPPALTHRFREWAHIVFTRLVLIGVADGDAQKALKRLQTLKP